MMNRRKKESTLEIMTKLSLCLINTWTVSCVATETVQSSGTHAQMNSIIVQIPPQWVCPHICPLSSTSALLSIHLLSQLNPNKQTRAVFSPSPSSLSGSDRLDGRFHGYHSVNSDQCCKFYLYYNRKAQRLNWKITQMRYYCLWWWNWDLRMCWVRCNDRSKEKRFILKCEYLFFRMIVYGYEILYTLFNIICYFTLDPVVLFLWCKADLLIVYMDVLLHNVFVVSCWLL